MNNNLLNKKKEFLEDFETNLILKLNEYQKSNKTFTLKDLLSCEQEEDYYYIKQTKGVLIVLVYFNFIEIYNYTQGKNNLIYKVIKQIKK